MSASEKLRALKKRHDELVIARPTAGENFAVDYLGPLANLSGDFARLIPQIVTVVEAAEEYPPIVPADWRKRLAAACAALEEALSE